MTDRKPLTYTIVLPFRNGDRVRINQPPYHTGEISGIEAHMNFSDEPHVTYRVRTDTPRRVSRYESEENLCLLQARQELP